MTLKKTKHIYNMLRLKNTSYLKKKYFISANKAAEIAPYRIYFLFFIFFLN
ncbi:hypothetical protein HMPREF9171_0301 [Streptococcus agalactiae ATCC 13813]|nr:hypothetical protein HMPREF9171_0301 [Streptococcus agalactiae ATCC 13813]